MKPKALLLDLGNVTVRLRGPGWLRRLGEACTPARTPEELMALLHEPDGPIICTSAAAWTAPASTAPSSSAWASAEAMTPGCACGTTTSSPTGPWKPWWPACAARPASGP